MKISCSRYFIVFLGYVEKLNVTMGFPIGATPVFNLVELLIELHINRKGS